MEEDTIHSYYQNIHRVLESKDVVDIAKLHRASFRMKAPGKIARFLINDAVPALAEYYGLYLDKRATFARFNREYKRQILGIEPSRRDSHLDEEFFREARESRKHATVATEERPALYNALIGAARRGELNNVRRLYTKIQERLAESDPSALPDHETMDLELASSKALEAAALAGHVSTVEFFLKKGVTSGVVMRIAAKNNDREMIRLLVRYGNKQWSDGQAGANEGGHLELRKLFSRKLAGMEVEF